MEIYVIMQDVEVGFNLDNDKDWPMIQEPVSAWETNQMAYNEKMRLRKLGYKKLSIIPIDLNLQNKPN